MEDVPQPGAVSHEVHIRYCCNITRGLFFIIAALIVIAAFLGAELPLSLPFSIAWVGLLGLLAAIADLSHYWLHYLNIVVAFVGLVIFGSSVIVHYHGILAILTSGLMAELIAAVFLAAFYFSMRTLRGELHM